MNLALIQASRKKRNKGWKRVQALAERISEKKMRGEWQGPDIPVPNFAQQFLKLGRSKTKYGQAETGPSLTGKTRSEAAMRPVS